MCVCVYIYIYIYIHTHTCILISYIYIYFFYLNICRVINVYVLLYFALVRQTKFPISRWHNIILNRFLHNLLHFSGIQWPLRLSFSQQRLFLKLSSVLAKVLSLKLYLISGINSLLHLFVDNQNSCLKLHFHPEFWWSCVIKTPACSCLWLSRI